MQFLLLTSLTDVIMLVMLVVLMPAAEVILLKLGLTMVRTMAAMTPAATAKRRKPMHLWLLGWLVGWLLGLFVAGSGFRGWWVFLGLWLGWRGRCLKSAGFRPRRRATVQPTRRQPVRPPVLRPRAASSRANRVSPG